ncbi:MAG: MauE/DoxX family redox-associated membrane protein [Candidatus Babeliaceae bacterium]
MNMHNNSMEHSPYKLTDFLPLIIIFTLIITFTFLRALTQPINWIYIMADFMGAFFVVFGGFKIMNWKLFAKAYADYDIIAHRISLYAYIYPLIECLLGIAYLAHWQLKYISLFTAILMVVSSLGIFIALVQKKQIMCACLGTFFNIPLTNISLVEDILMALMAFMMFFMAH